MLPPLRRGPGVFLAPFNVKTLPVFLVKFLRRHELLANQRKTELPCKYSRDSWKGVQALASLPPQWRNPTLIKEMTSSEKHRDQQTQHQALPCSRVGCFALRVCQPLFSYTVHEPRGTTDKWLCGTS